MAYTNTLVKSAGERTRVGGSTFTVFLWQGSVIGFGNQVSDVSPTPVGAGATPIMPMDYPYAVEIITPAALNPGTLTVDMFERYNQKVWDDLAGLTGAVDLAEIFIRIASYGPGALQLAKVVRPPNLSTSSPDSAGLSSLSFNASLNSNQQSYAQIYNSCVVSNVEDGETISIGTMAITKRITLMYAYVSYPGLNRTYSNNVAITLANNQQPVLSK